MQWYNVFTLSLRTDHIQCTQRTQVTHINNIQYETTYMVSSSLVFLTVSSRLISLSTLPHHIVGTLKIVLHLHLFFFCCLPYLLLAVFIHIPSWVVLSQFLAFRLLLLLVVVAPVFESSGSIYRYVQFRT